ncbi:MAG: hypothetical protein J3R72DRAFT_429052, partial [Linnemannia gamsii]
MNSLAQVDIHTAYNSNSGINDVGLVRLKHLLDFKVNCQPVNLEDSIVASGTSGAIYGWGSRESPSDHFLTGTFTAFSNEECQKEHTDADLTTRICAKESICVGEKCALFVVNGRLVAIASVKAA